MEAKTQRGLEWIRDGSSKKGYLLKQAGSHSGWKKRWFCIKGNELFYFENSDELKLQGKFVIESDLTISEVEDKKFKKEFCFKIDGKSLKKARILAGENDRQRKEWITAIESVIQDSKQGKIVKTEGFLSKQGPKRPVWKKRYCVLTEKEFLYYKQQKDLLPVGIVPLEKCKSLEAGGPDNNKPYSFIIETNNRKFYFYAETQVEMDQWTSALRASLGVKTLSSSSNQTVPREVFLCKPLKEGVLNKAKKRDQLKKTKPIRLALTNNFIYYFPNPSSNEKYHSIHLDDIIVETVPSSMERIPNSFRLVNYAHPLYLGAEDEKEYNMWLNIIEQAQQSLAFQSESKTDQDIKNELNIDYSVSVVEERVDSNVSEGGFSKSYDLKVKAFWTSWTLKKSYKEIYDLYMKIVQRFPKHIFPEAFKEPQYAEVVSVSKPGHQRKGSLLSKLNPLVLASGGKLSKPFDDKFDHKFISCLVREILRNRAVSQCDLMLAFFELDNIFSAISKGEIAFVRYFLDRVNADLKELNKMGQTPLHQAVEKNNKTIVEALVSSGADLNLLNKKGQTVLIYSIECGSSREVVGYLLDSGADINARDESGASALHLSIKKNIDILQLLLDRGAAINSQDKGLRSPAHIAIIQDDFESLKLLVEKNINLELQDEEGFTPLLMACWMKREDMVKFLLQKGAGVNAVDKNRRSATHLSVLRKDEAVLSLLVEAKAPLDEISGSGFAPIHMATSKGYETIVEFLISKGCNVEVKDENLKQTSLHIAASSNKPKLIETLLRTCGSLLDVQDGDGRTPLHIAADMDNISIVKQLLIAGARVDTCDKNQDTPLHLAAGKSSSELFQWLILNKSSLQSRNRDGSLPIHIAVYKGNEEVVSYLLTLKVDINVKNVAGNTPLHLALMQKHFKIATLLSENGANANITNMEGNSPLHYAPKQMYGTLSDKSVKN